MNKESDDAFVEVFDSVGTRGFAIPQIVSSAAFEMNGPAHVTVTANEPIRDENGDIIFLKPGTLSLGIICVYCGYNAMDSCEPDEDSKEMMAGVRADFNRHMKEDHGVDDE